jgi:CRISPR system Cascade subunit CasA
MVFEMGESRPKENDTWLDPFAAYRLKENKPPIPIRPRAGKGMWREYAVLFLRGSSRQAKGGVKCVRPRVLEQISELLLEMGEERTLSMRCVGLRTDMKAKVFEWVEWGFDVPTGLLAADEGGWRVQRAINLASECAGVIGSTFVEVFRGNSLKSERYRLIRNRMVDAYWAQLSSVFQEYVLGLDLKETDKTRNMETWWADQTVRAARGAFREASEQLPEKAADLAKKVRGEEKIERWLNQKRKEFLV